MGQITLAHLHQQCNNFKDPGVQCYGGEDFATQRDLADDIFCKLPPPRAAPKPKKAATVTRARYSGGGGGGHSSYGGYTAPAYSAPARTQTVNMSSYMNRGGGCFHGNSKVLMADGSQKQLRHVHAGDLLATQKGKSPSRVRCVVKSVQ